MQEKSEQSKQKTSLVDGSELVLTPSIKDIFTLKITKNPGGSASRTMSAEVTFKENIPGPIFLDKYSSPEEFLNDVIHLTFDQVHQMLEGTLTILNKQWRN